MHHIVARRKRYFLINFAVACLLTACPNPIQHDPVSRLTIIAYILADNNLELFALRDINEMEQAMTKIQSSDINVIAYMDKKKGYPFHGVTFKIAADTSSDVKSPIIRSYRETNSADAHTFQNIISDIIQSYPARSYMLMVWSHGSGWVPPEYAPVNTQKDIKSFGKDDTSGGREMSIVDFSQALQSTGIRFSALFFDACYMGDVEVAYELRNTSRYIIFSQTEIQSDGYPYNVMIPLIAQNEPLEASLKTAALSYYTYFDKLKTVRRTATLSVIKTAELPALANSVHEYVRYNGITELQRAANGMVQVFSLDWDIAKLHFDMKDLFIKAGITDTNYNTIIASLQKVLLVSYHTPKLFDQLELRNASGLSVYIPEKTHSADQKLKMYYKTLTWAKDSGIGSEWK